MNTKNIFRMLLVAATLLLGANNVKATETQIWPESGRAYEWTGDWAQNNDGNNIVIPKGVFDNLVVGEYLRIYGTQGSLNEYFYQIKFCANTDGWPQLFFNEGNKFDNYVEIEVTTSLINSLSNGGVIQGYNLYITRITRHDGSLESGENLVGKNFGWCNNWGNDAKYFSNAKFKKASSGNKVRIYGQFNSGWAAEFWAVSADGSWVSVPISEWRIEGESKYQANVNNTTTPNAGGYIEFNLTADNLAIINAASQCVIQGQQFEVQKITIYVPAPVVPKYNVDSSTTGYGQIEFLTNNYQIEAGTTVQFKLTPSAGYQLSSFTIKDSNQDNVNYTQSGGVYSFTMPALNVTVSATFTEITPETREVTVGGNGYKYSTWAPDIAIDYTKTPTGVKAYRAKGTKTTGGQLVVVLEQVTGKVYANTPVILAADTEGQSFTFTQAVTGASDAGTNLLRQGTGGSIGPNDNYYILTLKNGVVVFAQTKSSSALVPTDKAYLDLSSVSGARARTISLSFGDNGNGTTAINGIEENAEMENTVIYDLRGQRVDKPTKGLYIINGKKVMIK